MGFLHAGYRPLGYDLEGCTKDEARSWVFLDATWSSCQLDSTWGKEIGKLNGKN